jgi:aconitase A
MTKFNLPYILTNCHNSLCATGGTSNADDHIFALSAAKRFGGVYLPPHQAVMHQYMRETRTFCGGMLLGSDSHTRYGALGTMGIGEGGPELVKQSTVRTAFCGPCFGAGDTPANGALSIRHATRNFPFREGAKPAENQIAGVALMDARSIAATAKQGGRLANAMADPAIMSMDTTKIYDSYHYDADIYAHRVYNGYGHPQPEVNLVMGPGIAMWPTIRPLPENLLIVAARQGTSSLLPAGFRRRCEYCA